MANDVTTFVISARDNASGTISRVSRELKTMGGTAAGAAGPLGKLATVTGGFISPTVVAAAAVTGLGAALVGTIGGASDQAENLSKVGVVFEDLSGDMEQFADTAAVSMGLSETAALGALGTFGNLFTAMKIGKPQAADMSKGMLRLAGDLASFNNITVDEALIKLRAGPGWRNRAAAHFGRQPHRRYRPGQGDGDGPGQDGSVTYAGCQGAGFLRPNP